jgi:hypothetical protein
MILNKIGITWLIMHVSVENSTIRFIVTNSMAHMWKMLTNNNSNQAQPKFNDDQVLIRSP